MRIRNLARPVVLVTLGVATLMVALVSSAGAAPPAKYQITVSDSPGGYVVATIPPLVADDTYLVGFANNSAEPHVFILVGGLPEDLDVDGFIALLDSPAPPPEGVFEAGAVFSKPGQDHQKKFDVNQTGRYGFFCPIPNPDGVPHYQDGFVGLFDVVVFP